MSQLNELLKQADLAFAAYANFGVSISYKQDLVNAGMADAQAADFASKWTVAAQYTDASGVAATVFQENATGKRYLAIRGTESPGDFNADYILALGFPSYLNPQFIQLRAQVDTWLSNGTLPAGSTITGHSLGGYLAAAIGTWFTGQSGELYLYNAPGIGGPVGNALDAFRAAFGLSDTALVPDITSIRGTAGLSLISGLGAQLAPPLFVETESSLNPIDNHSIVGLTDSLALYAAYAQLDPTASVATITNILKASSNLNVNTLERALDNLRELLLGATTPGTVPESREGYYANLYQLTDWLAARTQNGAPSLKLDGLAVHGGIAVAGKSQQNTPDGLAYRYALVNLLPFAITGDASLYASHNASGELDLHDPATGTGMLTGQYLKDRAKMLSWKMQFDTGAEDDDDDPLGILSRNDKPYTEEWDSWTINGDWDFIDHTAVVGGSPLKLTIDGVDLSTTANHQIVFGSNNADSLVGDMLNDNLYGGGGNDTLTGGGGNDWLEGGQGYDTYLINPGDGTDTILDVDGTGAIVLDGLTLTGGALVAGTANVWKDTAHGITYTLQGSGASQILIIGKDGSDTGIRIQGWQAGQLGLNMSGAGTPASPATLTGADGYSDALTGTAGSDRILGLSGNDALDGGAGDDVLEGGLGDDLLAGGAGSDLIHGGAGRDMILSATGLNLQPQKDRNNDGVLDDWAPPAGAGAVWTSGRLWGIYADNQGSETIDGGGPESQDSAGDIVFAEDGNDKVIGGLGDDYLDGGNDDDMVWGHGGNDVIVGGAGNDKLSGDGILKPGFYQTLAETGHGNDILDGGAGNDQLVGGGKDDSLFGGDGNDRMWGDDGTEADLGGQYHGGDYLDGGTDDDEMYGGGGDDTLFGGTGNDLLWGDADDVADLAGQYHGSDFLDGGDGNDQLVGGGGDDVMAGGTGNDVMFGDARSGTVLPAQYHGDDILHGGDGDDYLYGGGGNDALYGDEGADALWGEDGDDVIDGGAGNDYLDGGTGADIMAGGADDDTYVVDDAGDVVIEAADGGNDTVNSAVDIVLPDNVEWLNLTGTDDLNATGNALDNSLNGNAGANRLEGGAGNDQLVGGAGADTLIGGTGDDYYEIDDAGDTIVELAGEGNDFVRSTVSYALAANVEGVELAGTADLDATGNAQDNSLVGSQGANTLVGGAGNDYLSGGAGDDTYVFNRGDGQDSIDDLDVVNAVNTLCFGVDIADTDVVGYRVGDDMVLKLKGSSEQVAFIGYYGADTVDGGVVSNRRVVFGSNNADSLVGDVLNDNLYGGGGNVTLMGGTLSSREIWKEAA